MKIVLLSTGSPSVDQYPPQGGIQYQIYHTAKELQRRGHDPTIVSRAQEGDLPRDIRFRQLSVPLDDDIVSRILFGHRATGVITEIDPDVVLAYERFSTVFPVRLDYPILFFTSNYDAMEFYRDFATKRTHLNRIAFPIKKHLEEYVMHEADRVIALNSAIKTYLQSREISHTSVIPNGVDVSAYRNRGDDSYIFYAGRLNEVKGVRFLIDAFSELKDEIPHIDLRITGDGEQRAALENQARELNLGDRIHFTGWVDRDTLHEHFSRCSIFVLPSLFETFGIVVLEAMASGKPVIASDIEGPRDILTDGDDGVLVDPGEIDQLQSAIATLATSEDEQRRIGDNARHTVENQFSFPAIGDQILDVCNDVI